jgi:hypothetical protein
VQQKALSPEIRAAVRMVRKYSNETILLVRNKIKTADELNAFIDKKKQDLCVLERQRGTVYNRMKSAKTPEAVETLKAERDKLSGKIKVVRQELFYAHDILSRKSDIARQIRIELTLRAERRNLEQRQQQSKPKSKERGMAR